MLTYAKLQSTAYWIEEENQRRETSRQEQARNSSQKFITVVAYSTFLAILGVAFAWGAFDNIDVLGAVERIGQLSGIAN